MTRDEHLMTIAMEECNEVAQRLSKALRFGMNEIQPGQTLTNRQRIGVEYTDLVALMEMLDILPPLAIDKDQKKAKVMKFLRHSAVCGTLTPPEPTCEHGTAMDVHCCGCHSGFLFDSRTCTCF